MKSKKQMKILTFYLKCALSRKKLEVSKIWRTVFLIAILPNILQKEKNEIGLNVYELKTEMWKKSVPSQNL